MEGKGWIKLYRNIQDNAMWKDDEPFDYRSAWIDLLLSATHSDTTLNVGGEELIVHPGQYFTSTRVLAKKWHWSRGKVERFLRLLEASHQTSHFSSHHGLLITIENWAFYQTDEKKRATFRATERAKNNNVYKQEDKEKNKKKNSFLHQDYDFEELERYIP